jgi:hypothetical protein
MNYKSQLKKTFLICGKPMGKAHKIIWIPVRKPLSHYWHFKLTLLYSLVCKTHTKTMNFKFAILALTTYLPLMVLSNHDVHETVHALFDRSIGEDVHLAFDGLLAALEEDSTDSATVDTASLGGKHFQVVSGHVNHEDYFFAHNEQGETVHLVRVKSADGTTPDVVVGSIVSAVDNAVYDIYADHAGHSHMRMRLSHTFGPEVHEGDDDDDAGHTVESVTHELDGGRHLRGVIGQDRDSRNLQTTRILDVLVVWTLNAECANAGMAAGCTPTAGSTSSMQGKIALAVSETNQAYVNSGINAQVRLVHSYRLVGYTESDSATSLNQLAYTNDGIIDDVHTVRSQVMADMVSMWMVEPNTCGRARYNYPTPAPQSMFSVVSWDCATGYYSFGHEIGHMMGCNHDRGSAAACTSTNTNFGYRSKTSRVRDIMAVDCKVGECDNNPFTSCTRVATFSGFANTQWGVLGDASNNCVAQINANVARVADFLKVTPMPTLAPTRPPTPTPTKGPTPAPVPPVCGDGVCGMGESCTSCPADCISGIVSIARCGNGVARVERLPLVVARTFIAIPGCATLLDTRAQPPHEVHLHSAVATMYAVWANLSQLAILIAKWEE